MAQKAIKVAIIGLGHFGNRLALDLTEMGAEVIAIDHDERKVEKLRDRVSHTIVLDATDETALSGVNISDYDHCVVAIGESVENSLLSTANLQKLKAKNITARACSETQEIILKQMGIENIILPEGDAASQVARQLFYRGAGQSINLSEEYLIMETNPPKWCIGKRVEDLHLIKEYSISIITLIYSKDNDQMLSIGKRKKIDIEGIISPDTLITKDCRMLIFGREKSIYRLLNKND